MKDFYERLGIKQEASKEDIKLGYFTSVKKYPLDRFEAEFMNIRMAYEVLSNEKTRKEYDLAENKDNYNKARTLIEEGDLNSAIKVLEDMLKENPKSLLVRALLADSYLKNNNSGKAIKIYEELTAEETENAAFAGYLAYAYLVRGWNKKAIKAYEGALELDYDNISLWIGLSNAYAKDENYDNAKKVLEKLLETNKDISFSITSYFTLIELEISFGFSHLVCDYLAKLVDLAKNNTIVKENIAYMLSDKATYFLQLGGAEDAEELNNAALLILPENNDILEAKQEIDNFNNYADLFGKLSSDDSIKQEIGVLIGLEVLPDHILELDEDGKDAMAYYNEYQILSQYDLYKSSIQSLKKNYPEFYVLISDFLDKAANENERRKMLKSYEKHSDKFFDLINGSPDFFQGEEDGLTKDNETNNMEQTTFVREEPKIGRNDPCICGSGKKYKKCCGR